MFCKKDDILMKIQVITLPNATERHERIKKSFGDQNLIFEFKNGVDINSCTFKEIDGKHHVKYKDYTILINEEKTIQNINRTWIRFGEIAAYIAHYDLWKKFLNSQEDKIIICEDDAFPNSNMKFLNNFNYDEIKFINLQTVTAHNQRKDLLYREPFVKLFNENLVLYKNNIPLLCEGLAAYLLTKDGAKVLCDFIETNGFVGPNDCLIAKLGQLGKLPIHSPVALNKCFSLDLNTYEHSYTHSGAFEVYRKFNKLLLQVRK
jgi:GR25 family glycosyltransferase involved in LPS biosynthesis